MPQIAIYDQGGMSESVTVNFARRFPLFPLPETILLPHALQPLAIFEPRFRQMIDHALDGSGQIAMGTFMATEGGNDVRPVVCLGQIVQHEIAPHGYNVLVYGLCRARIDEVSDPEDDRMYVKAQLRPMEAQHPEDDDADDERRDALRVLLDRPNMHRLERNEVVTSWIAQSEISTHTLFELVGCALLDDPELRYELLAEPSYEVRTQRIFAELRHLDHMLELTKAQSHERWDKGTSWN